MDRHIRMKYLELKQKIKYKISDTYTEYRLAGSKERRTDIRNDRKRPENGGFKGKTSK